MNRWLEALGDRIAAHLLAPRPHGERVATVAPELLAAALRPGDVLLVEGRSRLSMAIKVLTQSNWSHAALYVGNQGLPGATTGLTGPTLIEADLREGVRAVPLDAYMHMHTRICRPVGLAAPETERLIAYSVGRIGQRYDLKNLFDLARYLLHTPPIPMHRRRRMLAFGSGDPTRAICSTLIAQAFQAVHYPILPEITVHDSLDRSGQHSRSELLHIRNSCLFAPCDFDVSPYFAIVKPTLEAGFDPHGLAWDAGPGAGPPAGRGFVTLE
ncbi:MAG: YiiX/YebB-like N1pC/P60 family cysteine hydrolase [Burkholderiaceae bacterium]